MINEVKTYQALVEENASLRQQIESLKRQNEFLRNAQRLTSELTELPQLAG